MVKAKILNPSNLSPFLWTIDCVSEVTSLNVCNLTSFKMEVALLCVLFNCSLGFVELSMRKELYS